VCTAVKATAGCLADELHLQPTSTPPSAVLAGFAGISADKYHASSFLVLFLGSLSDHGRFLAVMVVFEYANGRFDGVEFPRGDCLDMRENACCSLRGQALRGYLPVPCTYNTNKVSRRWSASPPAARNPWHLPSPRAAPVL